ncbi:MAG: polysaccharide biosynthesis C-terminal domain-containing protein, partial [Lachnospiraceae bacterium]|nr:polysaccharide biosynthesis C-terminal domain-containing protein [Lachnospiraceae bacterium]
MPDHNDYPRTGSLLKRKFASYLLPTTLTMAALSLNEFVDSMIVAHLLGSHAMAVVNLGMPVMLITACFYTLFGNGGATEFARALGERNRKYAGTCFRVSILSAVVMGVLVMLAGLIFYYPLSHFLCREPGLQADFERYMRPVMISAPVIMTTLTFLEFLPPCGIPAYATAVNIIANVVNLLMDVVYIRVFHMGVEGASYATLTGYVVGLIPVFWVLAKHKIEIPKGKWFEINALKNIIVTGLPSSLVQLGFTLKIGYSNMMATVLGGTAGIIAFSLCIQSISVVSVFLLGAAEAATPLIAVLHGQKDHFGETTVLRSAMWVTTVSMVVSTVIFELFPRQTATIYNITEPAQLDLSVNALRIFVISFVFRGICIVFMRYMQAIGYHLFAMFISLFDGCIGIIPISWICIRLLGIDGVWAAYPLTAVILLVIVLIHNVIV